MEVWPSLELVDAQNLRLETEVDREGRHVKGGCAQCLRIFQHGSKAYEQADFISGS